MYVVSKNEMFANVLSKHYTNGFRLDSSIELIRFRRFIANNSGIEPSISDEGLTSLICACGILFNGKVYAVSAQTKKQIEELVSNYFNSGAVIIFYEAFFTKHEAWLLEKSVISVELLIELLRTQFSSLTFTQTYFGHVGVSMHRAIEGEILRVWENDKLLTYKQLAERLPYVPLERIKTTLGQNSDFIWNSAETYIHVSKVFIANEDHTAICETANQMCITNGYVSITGLPLNDVIDNNWELSLIAIQSAVFQICLKDNYAKHGKIITKEGDDIDVFAIIKAYCSTLDHCTLDDLLTFEKDLTGESYRYLQAGYDIMVRTDKNTFIAQKYLDFDVRAIDMALANFVQEQYAPLCSVTTFALFPYCGQAWNLFLLESYIWRFSDDFRLDSSGLNSRNVGCIVRKNSSLTYDEIMADAIARSKLPLDENIIADFLYENGYKGSRQKAKISALIKQSRQQINDRKDGIR